MQNKHIVIVAGEASGDHHGAILVKQLKSLDEGLSFSGIGGIKMQESGVELLENLAQFGVVGYVEVLRHFKVIRRAFNDLKTHLVATKPDLLILIDYPGFNLAMAKYAKSLGIKILYYISPQIWAWKEKRIHTIKKNVDMMAVILPFEKDIYQKAGVAVKFVGHPLTHTVHPSSLENNLREAYNFLPDSRIIGIAPGSRQNEIKRMLPVMLKVAEKLSRKHTNLEFILPIASTLSKSFLNSYLKKTTLNIKLVEDDFYNAISVCHSVMISSGTASLETALLKKPMVIVYKTSLISYIIGSQLIKVKYIGLANLLADKMIVPELIQGDFNGENLYQGIHKYLSDPDYYQKTVSYLSNIQIMLSDEQKDCSLDSLVLKLLN